jgi:hypothetical protein
MPTLAEVSTWGEGQVKAEIISALPAGWKFMLAPHPEGYWMARFVDDTGVAVWDGDHPALNLLLFDAYGWLYLRKMPAKSSAANIWRPRPDRTVVPKPKSVVGDDPEDLDPEEITSVVYGKHE